MRLTANENCIIYHHLLIIIHLNRKTAKYFKQRQNNLVIFENSFHQIKHLAKFNSRVNLVCNFV